MDRRTTGFRRLDQLLRILSRPWRILMSTSSRNTESGAQGRSEPGSQPTGDELHRGDHAAGEGG